MYYLFPREQNTRPAAQPETGKRLGNGCLTVVGIGTAKLMRSDRFTRGHHFGAEGGPFTIAASGDGPLGSRL